MKKFKNGTEYEEYLLNLPIASQISGEHEEHPVINGAKCLCIGCRIIRVKKRKTFRFTRSNCPGCQELFTSIFPLCDKCRKK